MSCVNELANPQSLGLGRRNPATEPQPDYAWPDIRSCCITMVCHGRTISTREPSPTARTTRCSAPRTTEYHNAPDLEPLPWFDTVRADNSSQNIQPLLNYYAAAKAGTLPFCGMDRSERRAQRASPALVRHGQAYTTSLVNARWRAPTGTKQPIFLAWDDWGGSMITSPRSGR